MPETAIASGDHGRCGKGLLDRVVNAYRPYRKCLMGHAAGLWWLNACPIVYVNDENAGNYQFGFAYGTFRVCRKR